MDAMHRFMKALPSTGPSWLALLATAVLGLGVAVGGLADLPGSPTTMDQVIRGRYLVMTHACGDCHNRNKEDPGDPNWLAGYLPGTQGQPFQVGPFKTYPLNLTPDMETGQGTHSERQIFNALRYGLDPDQTPDVVITSTTPGQGNFPATPHYLAPPMPWPSWRHMTDSDLWDIIAYLKYGIKAVKNKVPVSDEPPDHWASTYTPDQVGRYPLPPYPTGNEVFQP